MSKRSFRRLAAVTGAALAIGTMAPAMAARVTTSGDADVTVTPNLGAVSASGLTDGLLPAGLVPTALVADIAGSLLATPGFVLADGTHLLGDVLAVPTGLVGTALGTTLNANAGVIAGLGGVSLGANGLLDAPTAIVGSVLAGTGPLVGDALTTVGDATAPVQLIAGAGLNLVSTLPATVSTLPGTVLGLPSFITGSGLTGILGITGSANVLAGVMGSM